MGNGGIVLKIFLIIILITPLTIAYENYPINTKLQLKDSFVFDSSASSFILNRDMVFSNPNKITVYLMEGLSIQNGVSNYRSHSEQLNKCTNNTSMEIGDEEKGLASLLSNNTFLKAIYLYPSCESLINQKFYFSINKKGFFRDIIYPFSDKKVRITLFPQSLFLNRSQTIENSNFFPPDWFVYGGEETGISIEGNLLKIKNISVSSNLFDLRGGDSSILRTGGFIETEANNKASFDRIIQYQDTKAISDMTIEVTFGKSKVFTTLFIIFVILWLIVPVYNFLTSKKEEDFSKLNFLKIAKVYLEGSGTLLIAWISIVLLWITNSLILLLSALFYWILGGLIVIIVLKSKLFLRIRRK